MVPKHDYDCIKEINEQEIVEGKSKNPFAILKKIKIADERQGVKNGGTKK